METKKIRDTKKSLRIFGAPRIEDSCGFLASISEGGKDWNGNANRNAASSNGIW